MLLVHFWFKTVVNGAQTNDAHKNAHYQFNFPFIINECLFFWNLRARIRNTVNEMPGQNAAEVNKLKTMLLRCIHTKLEL